MTLLLLLTQVLSPVVEPECDPLHVGPSPGSLPHPPDPGMYVGTPKLCVHDALKVCGKWEGTICTTTRYHVDKCVHVQ